MTSTINRQGLIELLSETTLAQVDIITVAGVLCPTEDTIIIRGTEFKAGDITLGLTPVPGRRFSEVVAAEGEKAGPNQLHPMYADDGHGAKSLCGWVDAALWPTLQQQAEVERQTA